MQPEAISQGLADIFLADELGPAPEAVAPAVGGALEADPGGADETPKELRGWRPAELAGEYFSEELDVSYTIAAEDGGLSVLLPNARRATKVEARTKERFVGGQLELEFGVAAAAAGAAGGFVLGAGRVKNVAFTRAHL